MSRNIIPPDTLIKTSDQGVLAICECAEQYPGDELLAHGADYQMVDGEPVETGTRDLVYITRDGLSTGRYGTGVRGVTEEDEQAAETDDEPFCEDCGRYIRGWLHTGDERDPHE